MALANAYHGEIKAPEVRSYEDAERILEGDSFRLIGSNVALAREAGAIAVQLYDTRIIRYYPNGTFSVDNGGWNTPTTSRRVNQFTPRSYQFWHEAGILACESAGTGHEATHRRQGAGRLRCDHSVLLPVERLEVATCPGHGDDVDCEDDAQNPCANCREVAA